MSQRKLATAAGVTVSAVSYWETGTTAPAQKHLASIVEVMGLSMEKFYGPIPAPKKTKKVTAAKRAVA